MRMRVETSLPDSGQKLLEAGFPGEIRPQNQLVEENADQRFRLAANPPRDRRAYQDVLLRGVPRKQSGEGSEQRHEHGRRPDAG